MSETCPDCGATIPPPTSQPHECDPVVRSARMAADFGAWLATPAGAFAVFYAERERRTGWTPSDP